MRVIESEKELRDHLEVARREAAAAFGNDEMYPERLVRRARHVEVQIIGDPHGNRVHLFEPPAMTLFRSFEAERLRE